MTTAVPLVATMSIEPNHIVPASELLSALVEMSYFLVAKLLMEVDAVLRQIFILGLDERDTGIHVKDALSLQPLFEGFMELAAYPASLHATADINGCLDCPLIGIPRFEGTGIGITDDFSICLGHNLGIFLLDGLDTSAKLIFRRHIILKCHRRLFHVWSVNSLNNFRISYFSFSNIHIYHSSFLILRNSLHLE